ncbi:hypothetical protein XENOCAPTIV_026232, partial [Xenoophorus captivus]
MAPRSKAAILNASSYSSSTWRLILCFHLGLASPSLTPRVRIEALHPHHVPVAGG